MIFVFQTCKISAACPPSFSSFRGVSSLRGLYPFIGLATSQGTIRMIHVQLMYPGYRAWASINLRMIWWMPKNRAELSSRLFLRFSWRAISQVLASKTDPSGHRCPSFNSPQIFQHHLTTLCKSVNWTLWVRISIFATRYLFWDMCVSNPTSGSFPIRKPSARWCNWWCDHFQPGLGPWLTLTWPTALCRDGHLAILSHPSLFMRCLCPLSWTYPSLALQVQWV